jgi:SAM-dependent methyltransferase
MPTSPTPRPIIEWCPPLTCCDERWEEAYRRFETPEEERKKFRRRLEEFGVHTWDRSAEVLEIFCGTGNALHVWAELGYSRVEGVDLSRRLLEAYRGPAQLYVGDCRELRLPDGSRDVIAVQGGVHHLPNLREDLPRVWAEVARVLRPGGRFLVVEPWWTPFLRLVHSGQNNRLLRAAWPRYDALATMTEQEAGTYFRWLGEAEFIRAEFGRRFEVEFERISWGKWRCIGRPRPA